MALWKLITNNIYGQQQKRELWCAFSDEKMLKEARKKQITIFFLLLKAAQLFRRKQCIFTLLDDSIIPFLGNDKTALLDPF